MGEPLENVIPGESPARLLDAKTFNMQMEAARFYRDNFRSGAPGAPGRGASPEQIPGRLEVRVRADDALDQFSVIDLGDAVIDPEAAPQNAQNTPVYEAVTPAGGTFAILPAPIASGKIG